MSPGEAELAQREVDRAAEVLREGSVLLAAGAAEGATNRLYYAVFHATRAALAVRGLHAKTHSGQRTLFAQTFGEAPILDALLDLRIKADYAFEEYTTSLETLREHAVEAGRFIERCRTIVQEALERGPDEPDPAPDY